MHEVVGLPTYKRISVRRHDSRRRLRSFFSATYVWTPSAQPP